MMGTYSELLQFSILSTGTLISKGCEGQKIHTHLMNRAAPENTQHLTKLTASVLQRLEKKQRDSR